LSKAAREAAVTVELFVAVGFAVLRFGVGVMKITNPSSHASVDTGDEFFGFFQLGAPGGLLPD
jgi:hypothetical protein